MTNSSNKTSERVSRVTRSRSSRPFVLACFLTCMATVMGPLWVPSAGAAGSSLVGTFMIVAGSCSSATVSGSYFRMIEGGGNANGPFLSNNDSTCSDKTYNALRPGTDGGLATGRYQPLPSPAFDASGNSLADAIITPLTFYGVKFSVSTNSVDPQSGTQVPAPAITVGGTSLSGDLRSFSVSWNNTSFNQGSPKPDGSYPGNTTPVSGTYDASTGDYTLQWTSQIKGGPFDGFSGLWHLTGRFVAASTSARAPGTQAPTAPSHAATTGTATGARAASSPSGDSGTASGTSHNSTTSTIAASSSSGASSGNGSTQQEKVLATRTSVATGGWQAPAWLVLLIAAAGVLALGAMFVFDRMLRRTRAESQGAAS